MALRENIAAHPKLTVAAILCAILLSWGYVGLRLFGNDRHVKAKPAYFYNLTTGKLVVQTQDQIPPVTLPSGEKIVLAHVFACGDCQDTGAQFTAYLESYSEDAKQEFAKPKADRDYGKLQNGRLFSLVQPTPSWKPDVRGAADAILQYPMTKCTTAAKRAKECLPD